MSRFRIAPSILSADAARLGEEVRMAEAAGADWIHVDVMDGHFVPNLTMGPGIVGALKRAATVPLDVHLMISEPERYIERFAEAGATTIGVHTEACPHLHRVVQQIHAARKRACIALNPATPAEAIEPLLGVVEQILVMTVNPGFGGQSFIRETRPKIQKLRSWIDARGLDVDLVVDGGIDLDTVADAAIHGARTFVIGSAFFGSGDYKRFVDQIRSRLEPYEANGPAS